MRNRLFAVLIATVAGTTLWLVMSRRPETAANGAPLRRASHAAAPPSVTMAAPVPMTAPAAAFAPQEIPKTAVLPKPQPRPIAAVETAPEGPGVSIDDAAAVPPVTVLENMRSVVRQYSERFGGNPVGSNPEIAEALNGKNPRQVVFLNSDDGLRLNERGQLIDNWGTPFFFHQLSRTEMEIRSAGPDRRMWTADDLLVR